MPTLMLVTDRRLAGGSHALVRAVGEAVQGGVNVVQLREKDLPPDKLLRLACRLRRVIAGRALLLVNGPLEVALAAGADGVHLPEDAPALVAQDADSDPWGLLVGRSVHSQTNRRRAVAEGARYVVAGPVFKTRSHAGNAAAGTGIIESVAAAVPVPVIAIGGVRGERG